MKRAIVLSGGGAAGAYQIGFWQAIRELNIKYDIVTGTSVGAINGALMVQEDGYEKWKSFWENIKTSDVKKGFNFCLEKNLCKFIDEVKIRKSKIDFAIVTVKLKGLKKVVLEKSTIPFGKMIDFIVASSALIPFFKTKKIDGKHYIDGCFMDNLPIQEAVNMGADEIISVNVSRFTKIKKLKGKKIIHITPKKRITNVLSFSSEKSKRLIKEGYYDTLRILQKNV